MSGDPAESGDSLDERLAQADRQIRREQLRREIEELGGTVGGALGEEVSDMELDFLERVLAWERGPRSTHRGWLARQGVTFIPPAELDGRRLKSELWRLIRALADARVFLYHTNHLSDAELYARLWRETLAGECPDFARTRDDAFHWDFADCGSGDPDDERLWLTYHASEGERREHLRDFPDIVLPARRRAPFRRDHRLPVRD